MVRFDSESVEVRVEDAVGEIPVDATNIQDLAKAEQEKSTIVADVHPSDDSATIR